MIGDPDTLRDWGGGVKLRYFVDSETIEVTSVEGQTFTFETPGIGKGYPFSTTASYEIKDNQGEVTQELRVWHPYVEGVYLSYTRRGDFVNREAISGQAFAEYFAFGIPTQDLPESGTANYFTDVQGSVEASGRYHSLYEHTTATFGVNFETGSISTALHLVGEVSATGEVSDFGDFAGTGALLGGGPGFKGNFADNSGEFSGAFFGPGAAEFGYYFLFDTGIFEAEGDVFGRKK